MVKEKTTKTPKQPKTVKLSTLAWVLTAIVFIALVAVGSFKLGLDYKANDQSRVTAEAAQLVQTLKSQN